MVSVVVAGVCGVQTNKKRPESKRRQYNACRCLLGEMLPRTIALLLVAATASAASAAPRSVLMITVDDLRPQLAHAYDMDQTLTPNIDNFAEQALVFHRAYCQQAVCSPSRNSFMSGRRPDTTRVWPVPVRSSGREQRAGWDASVTPVAGSRRSHRGLDA